MVVVRVRYSGDEGALLIGSAGEVTMARSDGAGAFVAALEGVSPARASDLRSALAAATDDWDQWDEPMRLAIRAAEGSLLSDEDELVTPISLTIDIEGLLIDVEFFLDDFAGIPYDRFDGLGVAGRGWGRASAKCGVVLLVMIG